MPGTRYGCSLAPDDLPQGKNKREGTGGDWIHT